MQIAKKASQYCCSNLREPQVSTIYAGPRESVGQERMASSQSVHNRRHGKLLLGCMLCLDRWTSPSRPYNVHMPLYLSRANGSLSGPKRPGLILSKLHTSVASIMELKFNMAAAQSESNTPGKES